MNRLYASRQSGGRGLLSVEDTVLHECLSLSKHLASSQEPLLQQVFKSSQWSSPDHILSCCSVIAQTHYKSRHDDVARLIHHEIAKLGGFPVDDKWWHHRPPPVLENSSMKLLRDFTIQADRHLSHNRPDIALHDFHRKNVFLIDVAIPGDSRLNAKVNEKMERYTDLKIELQRMWKVRVVIVPLIIGCLGSVSKCLVKHLKSLIRYVQSQIALKCGRNSTGHFFEAWLPMFHRKCLNYGIVLEQFIFSCIFIFHMMFYQIIINKQGLLN